MIFAYILCITFGLIMGSLQLLRLKFIFSMADGGYGIDLTYEEKALSLPSFLVLLLCLPVILAIFYAEPWIFVDNFVTGKETPLVSQFSIFRAITFFICVIIGELFLEYFTFKNTEIDRQRQEERKEKRAEYEYSSNLDEWVKWRRQQAGSGHPDWTPPDEEQTNNQSSNSSYIAPMQEKALQTLDIPMGASLGDIREQYLKLAKKYHPDRFMMMESHSPELKQAEQKMKEINSAYDWLISNLN